MRSDIRHKMYTEIYDKIEDLYCNERLNVTQACKREKITPSRYYKICKTLGKPSVATEPSKLVQGLSRLREAENRYNMDVENIQVARPMVNNRKTLAQKPKNKAAQKTKNVQRGGKSRPKISAIDIDDDSDIDELTRILRPPEEDN